jgi:hypothetical protein
MSVAAPVTTLPDPSITVSRTLKWTRLPDARVIFDIAPISHAERRLRR